MADYKTAEVLRKASDILAERGWHQGDYVNPETGREVCAIGAIRLATGATVSVAVDAGDYRLRGGGYRPGAAFGVLREVAANGELIPDWNDHPYTTYEDVQLGFKRAVEAAESDAVG